MKLKHIIIAVLMGIFLAMTFPLHHYAEAHRACHGWGGELFLAATVLLLIINNNQLRQLWRACDENEVEE